MTRVATTSGPAQARMLAVVLAGMLQLAVRHGAAESNAAAELRPPAVERSEVRAPSIDDIRTLRTALQAYDRIPGIRGDSVHDLADLADVLVATGCRIGEALALRWDDVSIDDGRVTISATVTRIPGRGLERQEHPKTESSNRTLALPSFARDVLVRRRVAAYSEWVFPSANGTLRWPENVRTQWASALKGSTVAWITTKSCRKAVATLLKATDGLDAAKEQLGHSDVGVTSRHYVEQVLERPNRAAVLDAFAQSSE
nr:site-specific integrase [Subtercola boreus]